MRRPLALLAMVAGTAAAQPVTHPEACRVTIAVAPDDVRAEIEAWVAAEPRCERELEVRVVPTEEGLYLQARDPSGRVRERVVPDSQSAAVLVVSWMADDSIGPTLPVATPVREPVAEDIEQPPELGGFVVRPARAKHERFLAFGALGSRDDGGGVRAQIDLYSWRRWRLGVAAGTHRDIGGHARLVLGTSAKLGPLSLRAQIGFGVEGDDRRDDRMDRVDTMDDKRHRMSPSVETGLFARVPLSARWGVIGGPLVEGSKNRERPTMSMFLGVQHGL